MIKQVCRRTNTLLLCSTLDRPQLQPRVQHWLFKRHVDYAGKIWMWAEWRDQEKNRNLENTVSGARQKEITSFAPENTAMPLSAVSSVFQKTRLKCSSCLLLAEQKVISVRLSKKHLSQKKRNTLKVNKHWMMFKEIGFSAIEILTNTLDKRLPRAISEDIILHSIITRWSVMSFHLYFLILYGLSSQLSTCRTTNQAM